MQYIYCFMNATLVSRVLYYLLTKVKGLIKTVTVIYLLDRWILCIHTKGCLESELAANFKAFLKENGFAYTPPANVEAALTGLNEGFSPTRVMNHFQVVIVSHGLPSLAELEAFRHKFIEGLGYCPQSLV
jgi:hypothetical protein